MPDTSPQFSRAEVLLQKYYDDEITVLEARELVSLWDELSGFDDYARDNLELESIFRFYSSIETDPLSGGHTCMGATGSPFRHLAELVREDPLDMMLLIEMASMTSEQSDLYGRSRQFRRNARNEPDLQRSLLSNRFIVPFLLLLVAGLIGSMFLSSRKDVLSSSSPATPIAVITDTASVEWNGHAPFGMGEPILGGRLVLKSGYVELLLFNGNRVVLEGPADVSLLSNNQLFCRAGKLSATVPRSGIGLEIQTPHTSVIDLGTAFLLDVSSTRSDVHVVEGLVQILENGDNTPTRLQKGDACEIRTGAAPSRNTADFSRFISLDLMKELSARCPRNTVRRARVGERTASEPILNLDFSTFEKEDAGRRTFGSFTVQRIGGTLVEGRANEEKAFRPLEKTDYVHLDSSAAFDSLALSVWVRLDKLDSFIFHPLLTSGASAVGGILWQIAPDGSLGFGFRSRKTRNIDSRFSPIVFTEDRLGRRTHLALVVDRRNRSVTHYCDGCVVAALPFDESRPIRLRDSLIANWKPKALPIQPFSGSLDDFRIYDRALSPDEVYNIYAESADHPDNPH